ncbi:protein ROOT INITIATION DEFECTIVE 3 [Tripterygium wilfordii]|uniref:Protein ROOT INITIATION DEFECTIVE 3 n=1 Tax=Tripterygium wilfordii TaxID=458696 RepID=A0A7J7DKZ6_TRIWF|nr:protein ROOT INITIATION DEFECTIVE 3 [Tripterygium wilfordii]KAF5747040.1 protein ROOT INITIATION DEFECTIVE 3 [Tripterygium wilfordii]
MELVIASSSVDAGIGCWELHTGAERLRYKGCASSPRGLACVGGCFLASSQLREPSASSGSILYWSWSKPQVEVKSFPEWPINPVAANQEGTYVAGGGSKGDIYLWEVATGRLLKKWRAHYRAVTCLVFYDNALLISGSEDGSVKVWNLIKIFDVYRVDQGSHLYEHSFSEHTLRVTDIVAGYGSCNAIIVSASEDRTCKVWSLSKGELLRNIVFPSKIDAIALDPGEHVFYAGSRDGKIYIAALSAESSSSTEHGMHIVDSISNHSKAVTCLAYAMGQNVLLSGSEDGIIRVWDPKTHNIIRVFKHAKGPVNNILVVRQPLHLNLQTISHTQGSSRKRGSLLPPPLEKYESKDENTDIRTMVSLPETCNDPLNAPSLSLQMIDRQIKEFQQQGSATTEMEVERLKQDCKRAMQMVEQWKKMYDSLHGFCINELLDEDQVGSH